MKRGSGSSYIWFLVIVLGISALLLPELSIAARSNGGPFKAPGDSTGENKLGLLDYLEADVVYMGAFWGNVAGGRRTGTVYMDNMDVTAEFDPSVWGWEGARFWFYLLGNQGGSISSLAGDVQGISNIEAVNSWRLYEALYFQRFNAISTSFMGGIYDVNAEFDLTHTGSFFLNSSHGIGAGFGLSGVTGPSTFPYTSLAIRIRSQIASRWVFKAAAVDGVPTRPGQLRGTTVHLDKEEGGLLTAELSHYGKPEKSSGSRSRDLLSRAIETAPGFWGLSEIGAV